jgi:hypothetical protein
MPIHLDALTTFLLGALLGSLVTLALVQPWLGRILLRGIGVVALGLGAFMLIWPSVSMIRREPDLSGLRRIGIDTVSEAFGCSAFLFVFGGLTLGFSFRGSGKQREQASPLAEGLTLRDVPPSSAEQPPPP